MHGCGLFCALKRAQLWVVLVTLPFFSACMCLVQSCSNERCVQEGFSKEFWWKRRWRTKQVAVYEKLSRICWVELKINFTKFFLMFNEIANAARFHVINFPLIKSIKNCNMLQDVVLLWFNKFHCTEHLPFISNSFSTFWGVLRKKIFAVKASET